MQDYSKVFARVYNSELGGFARRIAPIIINFYEQTEVSKSSKYVLDLCCGTGQLAQVFLERGYKVSGIDLSEDMLFFAKENNKAYLQSGQADFFIGDAVNFNIDKSFGLVVSTYDAINHLENEKDLISCFKSVFSHIVPEGYFIFDLNMRAALENWKWHSIDIIDRRDLMMVSRGIFDKHHGKAYFKWSGFVQTSNGLYERFEQTVFNTVFDSERIEQILREVGWKSICFAKIDDLWSPIDKPEMVDEENVLYVIAQK